ADRIIFLQEGRVTFFGTWHEFEDSQEPFIRNFRWQDELIPALDVTLATSAGGCAPPRLLTQKSSSGVSSVFGTFCSSTSPPCWARAGSRRRATTALRRLACGLLPRGCFSFPARLS